MNNIEKICRDVIEILEKKSFESDFGVELDSDTNIYHIWYNKFELADNVEFNRLADELLENLLYSRDIFNVFVAYSYKHDLSNSMMKEAHKNSITAMPDVYNKFSEDSSNCEVKMHIQNNTSELINYVNSFVEAFEDLESKKVYCINSFIKYINQLETHSGIAAHNSAIKYENAEIRYMLKKIDKPDDKADNLINIDRDAA